ncbi:MAG: oligosaccharide flippase family protein [Desulfosporosinus sp.]|nr:oligosaccharide flippase family protein [Desulfosporosinus sp.]
MSISKSIDNEKIRVIYNIIWAIIAVLSNFLVSFFLTPYVMKNMGIEAYGFVSLSTILITYIDIIAIALNAYASRYISIYYHKGEYDKANVFFNSIIFSNIFLAIMVFIPSIVIIGFLEHIINISAHLLSDVKLLFFLVLIDYFIITLSTAFSSATFIKNRLNKSETVKGSSYILRGIILLILCHLFYPHVWYIAVASIITSLYILLTTIYFTKNLTPELKIKTSKYSLKAIRELLSAGLWNSLNSLGNVLNNGLDLIITNLMLSAQSMGYVSVGENLSTIFNLLLNAISNAFKPRQLSFYALNEKEKLINELKFSMKCSGMITGLVFAGFISCGKYFLQLWIPAQNIDVIYVVTGICLFGNLIVGVVTPLYYVYTLTKKLKLPSIITLCMGALNVLFMLIFLKYTKLGVYAVVITTAALNYMIHIFDAPIYSAHCLGLKRTTFYPAIVRHFISCLITTAVLYIIVHFWPEVTNWNELGLLGIVCFIAGVVVLLVTVLNNNERQILIRKIRKKLHS